MKYLYMDIYEKFQCIGGKCPDSCCVGWTIPINMESVKQYQKMQSSYSKKVLENIESVGENYRIKLTQSGRCPFLNNQNLCDIYIHISPEAMFPVCQTYPRKIKRYYNMTIITLYISCPEVCRMLLEKSEYISWGYAEDDQIPEIISPDWQLYNALINGMILSNKVVTDTGLSIRQKSYLLLRMAELMQQKIESGDLASIRQSMQDIQKGNYEKYLQEYKVDRLKTGRWESLYDILETMNKIISLDEEDKNMLQCFHIIKRTENEKYERYKEKYCETENQVQYTNLMLTYLLQYYMDSLNGVSIVKNILKALLTLIFFQTYEMLEYYRKGALTETRKVTFISRLARIVENSNGIDVMADRLIENNKQQELYQLIGFIM